MYFNNFETLADHNTNIDRGYDRGNNIKASRKLKFKLTCECDNIRRLYPCVCQTIR